MGTFGLRQYRPLYKASRTAITKSATFFSFITSAVIIAGCSPQIRSTGPAPYQVTTDANQSAASDHLVVVSEPGNTAVNSAISPTIEVEFVNQAGQVDTSVNSVVSLAIGTNPASGTLSGNMTVTAVDGISTFSNLSINTIGNGYTLVATADGVAAAPTTSFDILPGTPSMLAFSTQPTSAASGASLGNISVEIEDANGNLVTNSVAPVTLTIGNNAGPGGTLSGSVTVNAVGGIATLPGLSIDVAGLGYTLVATSGSLVSATSTAFNISASTANKLAFTTQPVSAASGANLGGIAVTVEDAAGNKITSSSASITLAIGNNAGPGGTLSGTATVNAINGVATFSGLSINIAGTGYTLTASSSPLTGATSSAFNIGVGTASKLAFTTQPSNAASGASLGSIAVAVEDAAGNIVTGSTAPVTLAIGTNAGPGGVLSGTLTVSAVSGVATFPGLGINLDGTGYTLTAISGSLTGATSSAFNITSSGASKLAFTTQPVSATSGSSLGSITVAVEDATGNLISGSTAPVTLAIGNNAGPGGALSGTVTVSAVNGVATFPGLNINLIGTGYTLTAASGSLAGATSTAFNITAGSASKLVFSTQPSSAASGASLGSIAVTVEDAAGNIVTSSSASITLAIGTNPGPGGVLSGTQTVAASSGVATFPGLSINLNGTGYTLTAASGSLTGATSSAFNITAGTATKLAFTTQPVSAASGASLGSITVAVEDAAGNVVTGSTAPVTLAIGNNAGPGGALSGTLTVNAISGVASFSGLSINIAGLGYTLSATSGLLTAATSSAFNISAVSIPLTVGPAYPNNGGNWTYYVKNDGADIFSASDTACAGTETGYAACLHGGQMQKVALTGVSSCAGLSMTDSLGVFVWSCVVKSGVATFFSTDFQQGMGLQNLVNASGWNNESVTLSGINGGISYSGTSTSSAWWSNVANPVTALSDNHLISDSPISLSVSGSIYVLASSRASEGYSIAADHIAIVTLPGVTMNYGGNNNGWCGTGGFISVVCAGGQNFIWVEGSYDANSGGGTDASNIVAFYANTMTNFSRVHLVSVKNSTADGIDLHISNSIVDQIKTSGNFGSGFWLASSANSFVKEVTISVNLGDGLSVGNGFGPDSTGDVFYQIASSDNGSSGIDLTGATGLVLAQVSAFNNGVWGVTFANNTITNNILSQATSVNNADGGFYIATIDTTFNTANSLVVANNPIGMWVQNETANNTFSQMVATNNTNYGVQMDANGGDNQNFSGALVVGSNTNGDCNISAGTNPGLINTTCSDTGVDGSSSYTGQLSNAVLRTARNLSSSFVGKVTVTDPTNSSNTNGMANFPGTLNTFDFGDFSNLFRGWGLDGLAFPDASNQGQWTSGAGRIWDMRLLASDTTILNRSGDGATSNGVFTAGGNCPAASDGTKTATDQWGHTYLLNAQEIVDPFNPYYSNTGNHNGLCESGDTCIYTPNFGAYQGEGTLQHCTFVQSGGPVSGVTMYGYTTNGD